MTDLISREDRPLVRTELAATLADRADVVAWLRSHWPEARTWPQIVACVERGEHVGAAKEAA